MNLVYKFKSSIILALISLIFYLGWKGYASPIVLMIIELFVSMNVDKAMEIACNNANIIGCVFLVIFILSLIITFISIIRNLFSHRISEVYNE